METVTTDLGNHFSAKKYFLNPEGVGDYSEIKLCEKDLIDKLNSFQHFLSSDSSQRDVVRIENSSPSSTCSAGYLEEESELLFDDSLFGERLHGCPYSSIKLDPEDPMDCEVLSLGGSTVSSLGLSQTTKDLFPQLEGREISVPLHDNIKDFSQCYESPILNRKQKDLKTKSLPLKKSESIDISEATSLTASSTTYSNSNHSSSTSFKNNSFDWSMLEKKALSLSMKWENPGLYIQNHLSSDTSFQEGLSLCDNLSKANSHLISVEDTFFSEDASTEGTYLALSVQDYQDFVKKSSFTIVGDQLLSRILREKSRVQLKRDLLKQSPTIYLQERCGNDVIEENITDEDYLII
mmetsp:Transcript_18568/g.26128  ORF Transcript_18568/g.26128 Transcript_18568/m.26128 type:complete len:351 (+) Transcript_18568:163-1215(+)